MSNEALTKSLPNHQSSTDERSAVVVALESPALVEVIRARRDLSITLAKAAALMAVVTAFVAIFGQSTGNASQVIEFIGFTINADGSLAVLAATSMVLGYFAYKTKPELNITPTGKGISVSLDKSPKNDKNGRDDDDDDPPPSSPGAANTIDKDSSRARSNNVLTFPRKK